MPKSPTSNPPLTPELRAQMADVVAAGVSTYMYEFTRKLWPDVTEQSAQDCVAEGIVQAIHRYERQIGRPISQAVALALIEKE